MVFLIVPLVIMDVSDSESAELPTLTDVGLDIIQLTGGGPNGLDIDPETGLVYVVMNGGQWCGDPIPDTAKGVSIVDPANSMELDMVSTDLGPVWPLVDTQRNLVYVAASGAPGTIAIHKRGTGEKVGAIEIGGMPHDLGLDPNSGILIASNTKDSSQTYMAVVDLNTQTLLAHHQIGSFPHKIEVDSNRSLGYVLSLELGLISVVDMTTGNLTDEFSSGDVTLTTGQMAYSPSLRRLYVTKTGSDPQNAIVVINADTSEIVGAIPSFTSDRPSIQFGVEVDETSGLLFAAIASTSYVGVADMTTLEPLGLIEVDFCPWAIGIDETRRLGFSTGNKNSTLSVFDLDKVVEALGIPTSTSTPTPTQTPVPIPAMGSGTILILVALITLLFVGLVARKRITPQ